MKHVQMNKLCVNGLNCLSTGLWHTFLFSLKPDLTQIIFKIQPLPHEYTLHLHYKQMVNADLGNNWHLFYELKNHKDTG